MANAFQSHDLLLLETALEAGINPDTDVEAGSGVPILGLASHQEGLEAIKLLVKYGVNVNRRSDTGVTAISEAILTLGLDEVIYLLDQGANPNVVDYYGTSFAWLLYGKVRNLEDLRHVALPKAYAIRDRIIRMGVQWPPMSPEALRQLKKEDYRAKTGKEFLFVGEEGWRSAGNIPAYVPAPVRKTPLRRDLPYEEVMQLHRRP